MSLIKQLVEMDPFMAPIGGIVCPPKTPIQSTTEQPDCVVPDRRERLLKSLMFRTAAEEEEEMGPEEPTGADMNEEPADVCADVVEFIKNFESPTEEDFEQAASQCGMPVEELKLTVFDLARSMLMGIGKHGDVPDEEFDPEELQKGIEVEMEHVNNPMIAKLIAKDHLMEIPDYYNRLEDLEQEGQDDQAEVGDGEVDPREAGRDYDMEDEPQDEEEYK
jgi:Protein of unknown function (DUF5661)